MDPRPYLAFNSFYHLYKRAPLPLVGGALTLPMMKALSSSHTVGLELKSITSCQIHVMVLEDEDEGVGAEQGGDM